MHGVPAHDGRRALAQHAGPAFNVADVRGCVDPCVQHRRFANDSIGYAFGQSALFMTTDGGQHWQRQKGMGADALETLSGNVILAHLENASPPIVARAPIGSANWVARSPAFPKRSGLPVGATRSWS